MPRSPTLDGDLALNSLDNGDNIPHLSNVWTHVSVVRGNSNKIFNVDYVAIASSTCIIDNAVLAAASPKTLLKNNQ